MSSSDEENPLTVEDLLSSVLQTKSKLSGAFNTFKRRPICDGNDSSNSRITPAEKSNFSSMHRSNFASYHMPGVNSQNRLHTYQSTSKMVRSVSTPEINAKYMPTSVSYTKSNAYRKVDFSSKDSLNCEYDDDVDSVKDTDAMFESTKNSNTERDGSFLKGQDISKSNSLSNLIRPRNYTDNLNLCKARTDYIDNCKSGEKRSHSSTASSSILPLSSNINLTNSNSVHKYANDHYHKPERPKEYFQKPVSVKSTSRMDDSQLKENIPVDIYKTPSKPTVSIQHKSPSPSPSLKLGNSDLISVNKLNYFTLKVLGKGGSSVVHEVLDLQIRQRKAIKIVSLEEEDEVTRNSYRNEIKILKRLQHSSRVIRLYDHEETSSQLKLVMEAGEIDLAGILSKARHKKGTPIPAYSIKHYWEGMLLAVQVIHGEGIIHSDLKPANFLLVNGTLKLIDFGIASSVQQDMTSVFKDSQSGTYNYMSPESLNDIYSGPIINGKVQDKPVIKINMKSDVWSLGCILYNLVYGKTPFQHLTNALQKLGAISNANTVIGFPPVNDDNLLDVMKKCLQFYAYKRPSITELLKHPYLSESLSRHDGRKGSDGVGESGFSKGT